MIIRHGLKVMTCKTDVALYEKDSLGNDEIELMKLRSDARILSRRNLRNFRRRNLRNLRRLVMVLHLSIKE